MLKYIAIGLTVIVTSLFFFPFEFTFLPGANTKMIMAGVGLFVLLVQLARGQKPQADKQFLILSLWALLVSFWGFASVTINETHDYTYATYIVSMWVWLSAAYVVVTLIRAVHGKASVRLVGSYLVAVCVLQCLLALVIDNQPAVKTWVNSMIAGHGFVSQERMEDMGRLYGIGATLDVAGLRFSAVLVVLAFFSVSLYRTICNKYQVCYLLSFFVIAVVGNMIARTTTVGVIMVILYWLICSKIFSSHFNSENGLWKWLLGVSLLAIPLVVYCYQSMPAVREDIRFAFEGFFSLAEKGEWDVNSNENLKNMIVFPESWKTWIIGDGYMENPYFREPYYTGPRWYGYYMGTDIGYLRFIFYFGLLGLLSFCIFFVKATQMCIEKFKNQQVLFWLLLAVNMVVWCKVSTDIFLVFALFLCVNKEENEAFEERITWNEGN